VLITTAIFEIEEVGARRMEMGVMRGEGYVGVGMDVEGMGGTGGWRWFIGRIMDVFGVFHGHLELSARRIRIWSPEKGIRSASSLASVPIVKALLKSRERSKIEKNYVLLPKNSNLREHSLVVFTKSLCFD
jgi:hypothetical protein